MSSGRSFSPCCLHRKLGAARSGNKPVSLIELQHELKLPLVEIWLGLLLGNRFELEQQGDFYDLETVWINSK